MKRKIIKLAEKTHVVSLPTTWLVAQNLKKGDEIDCLFEDEKLIFVPPRVGTKKEITLSLDGMSERVLRWNISSLHKQGYDEIVITNYNQEQYDIIQDLISHLFIGFIIKEKSKLRIVVGEVARVDVKEFDAMLRRGFRLLLQCFEELTGDILALEQENNKVTNFCERLLNKFLIQKEKGHFWYVVAWNLEKIVDNFKYLKHDGVLDTEISEDQNALIEKTRLYVHDYYECFYSFSYDALEELTEQKKKLISLWKQELQTAPLLSHHFLNIITQVSDFSASMIAVRK